MLKSYEAIYENGQVKWLGEKPDISSARLIVTVLEESESESPKQRSPSQVIAGKGKTLGDIVSPLIDDDNLATKIERRFADLGDFDLPEIPREAIKIPPDFTEL